MIYSGSVGKEMWKTLDATRMATMMPEMANHLI